ncbi:unnamed protein product, partial [Brassica rapa subsp. trilocularis]
LSSSLIVSQVFTVIKRLLRHVVLNGLTSLSEKRHPMMAYSHMDVARGYYVLHAVMLRF